MLIIRHNSPPPVPIVPACRIPGHRFNIVPEPVPCGPFGIDETSRAWAIIKETCDEYRIHVSWFYSSSRRTCHVRPRWHAAYRLRTELGMSLLRIAREFGGMDHTTILHGIRRHAELHGLPVPKFDLRGRRLGVGE